MMKCAKCNSENVQIQSKEYKPKFTAPILLVFIGFGMMFFGLVGVIGGAIIGLIISVILNAVLPQAYQSVLVCQNCGYTAICKGESVSNSQAIENFNLAVIREPSKTGSRVLLSIRVDDRPIIDVANGKSVYYTLERGKHTIFFQQKSGIGSAKRTGAISVEILENQKTYVHIAFTKNGVSVI